MTDRSTSEARHPRAPDAPRVTVVVTTHDRPDYAARAVRSALAQTHTGVEVVVVDDGSSTPVSLPLEDPRVRIARREVSGGMCVARNDGLALARGDWVTFLDDDDELVPEMVERSLDAVRSSDLPAPVAVMTALVLVSPDGTEQGRWDPPTRRRGEACFRERLSELRAKNSLVMPTEVVRAIGGWDPRLRDWDADDFALRLVRAASIEGLDEPLYRLTQHDGVRASRRWAGIADDMERTLVAHGPELRARRAIHAQYESRLGWYRLMAGEWGSAVRWCTRGLVRDPRSVRRWLFVAAALAGPHARTAYRRLRPREATVGMWRLTGRRAQKLTKRWADFPRAAAAAPFAALTRAVVRARRLGASRPPGPPGPPDEVRTRSGLLLCVYRAGNAGNVIRLADEVVPQGWTVRCWALDEVAPALAAHTVGVGSGAKFPLLNALVGGLGTPDGLDRFDWVVVADDDFVFAPGSIDELLAIAEAAGLEFVQPAHVERSHREHGITVRRPLSVARRTTWVEIGPVFAVHRRWAGRVLPFPPEHTMGWGLELEWTALERGGARLGIVDAVPIRHLGPVGRGYAKREQRDRLDSLLAARGLDSVRDVQHTLGSWRPWQGVPPWSRSRFAP